MRRFKPAYGVGIVLIFVAAILAADYALSGGFYGDFERVAPDSDGRVILDVSELENRQVRFFRFLNTGNQEVKFFVGRDLTGQLQVAFDASETDYKRKRGFRHEGDWLVNNKCDTTLRLSEVNEGLSGCRPVPLKHRLVEGRLILEESDILAGWRYFR
ncbi:MAG: DUF2318 domain-containing protein [Thermoanaerobaculia bacterium]|nr:DUF2318 domain-containing protein [Thermoanaerobaculia bacterium]